MNRNRKVWDGDDAYDWEFGENGCTLLDWTKYERESGKKARLDIAELLREKGKNSGAIQTNR